MQHCHHDPISATPASALTSKLSMSVTKTAMPAEISKINAILIVHDAETTYAAASTCLQTDLDDQRTTGKAMTTTTTTTDTSNNSDDYNYIQDSEEEWMKTYLELKAAYDNFGSNNNNNNNQCPPDSQTTLGRLALWTSRQRMFVDHLSVHKKKMLEQLAQPDAASRLNIPKNSNTYFVTQFDWGKQQQQQRRNANHQRWEDMYHKLLDFARDHGHVRVPIRWKVDPTLGKWVSRQRDTAAQLSQERAFKLNQVGFVWQCGNNTIHLRLAAEGRARKLAEEKAQQNKNLDPQSLYQVLMEEERKKAQREQALVTQHRQKRLKQSEKLRLFHKKNGQFGDPPVLPPRKKPGPPKRKPLPPELASYAAKPPRNNTYPTATAPWTPPKVAKTSSTSNQYNFLTPPHQMIHNHTATTTVGPTPPQQPVQKKIEPVVLVNSLELDPYKDDFYHVKCQAATGTPTTTVSKTMTVTPNHRIFGGYTSVDPFSPTVAAIQTNHAATVAPTRESQEDNDNDNDMMMCLVELYPGTKLFTPTRKRRRGTPTSSSSSSWPKESRPSCRGQEWNEWKKTQKWTFICK